MKRALIALVLVTLSGAVFAQPPQNAPKFDAADINLRVRTGTTNQPTMTGGVLRGGRYDLRNATMLDLIATASSVTDRDLDLRWAGVARAPAFDIAAKAPQDTTPAAVRLMLQSLLAERFKLAIHPDTRPMSGYVLTLGKDKHKLKEASGAWFQDAGQPAAPSRRRPSRSTPGRAGA